MPIKLKEPKTFRVEFDDMAGEHWIFEISPVPDDVLSDLQKEPEKVLSDTRSLAFVRRIEGPIDGTIETEGDVEKLKEAIKRFGGVLTLLNTGILKSYMSAIERYARAEKT